MHPIPVKSLIKLMDRIGLTPGQPPEMLVSCPGQIDIVEAKGCSGRV